MSKLILILSHLISLSISKKFASLSKFQDTEYEEIPEFFTFIASVRHEEIPFACGSLISDDHVLVLANLLDDNSKNLIKIEDLSCRVGDYLTNVEGPGIKVKNIFFPEFYNFSLTYGNIAILELEHSAISMSAIDVPVNEKLQYGAVCKIIGWSTHVPKKKMVISSVYLADIHECKDQFAVLPMSNLSKVPKHTEFDPKIHICLKSGRTKSPNSLEPVGSLLICDGTQHGILVFDLTNLINGSQQTSFWLSIRLDNFSNWISQIIL